MRQRIAWYEQVDLRGPAIDTLAGELVARGVSIDPTLVAYHTKFWWGDSIYQRNPEVAIVPEELENWKALGMPTAAWTRSEFERVQRGSHHRYSNSRRIRWVMRDGVLHRPNDLLRLDYEAPSSSGLGPA
jgi:hypothetical protein